jgi:hypothetical protein
MTANQDVEYGAHVPLIDLGTGQSLLALKAYVRVRLPPQPDSRLGTRAVNRAPGWPAGWPRCIGWQWTPVGRPAAAPRHLTVSRARPANPWFVRFRRVRWELPKFVLRRRLAQSTTAARRCRPGA